MEIEKPRGHSTEKVSWFVPILLTMGTVFWIFLGFAVVRVLVGF